MSQYTKQELEEAKTSLASTLSKCEKIQEDSGGRQAAILAENPERQAG